MEGIYGSNFHPCVSEMSLRSSRFICALLALIGLMDTLNSPVGRYNPHPAAHLPLPPTHPNPHSPPYSYMQSMILQ